MPSSARTAGAACDGGCAGVTMAVPYFDMMAATTSAPATNPQAAPIPKMRTDGRGGAITATP
jgi:hypothetical protein